MKSTLSRRDFLKLTTLFSLNYAFSPRMLPAAETQGGPDQPNFLIVVFDAWSAANISLYGYERKTTPNLARLADKAIVYHQHYAGGHFTTPGTASLLTGTLPWKHRAFELYQQLDEIFLKQNIFHTFPSYHRFAYTHNPLADFMLKGLVPDIDDLTPRRDLYLESNHLLNSIFETDYDTASVGWNRAFNRFDDGYAYTLYLSHIFENITRRKLAEISQIFPKGVSWYFPNGVPNRDDTDFFTLEQGINWLSEQVKTVSQPFLGYYHFLPPHEPYKTRVDFSDSFAADGYQPPEKPQHLFGSDSTQLLNRRRAQYDEFIRYVDAEFNRLYQNLDQNGLLENTWLVLTSDHGEMFERGIKGHSTPALYQPVMRVPLMIFPAGGQRRADVFTPTSAIDLLPTFLNISGRDIPAWIDGQVLPKVNRTPENSTRQISTIQVDKVEDGVIKEAVAIMIEENYKLIWTIGYEPLAAGEQILELYDIKADPEEFVNLYPTRKRIADELLSRMRPKVEDLQRSYQT